MHVVKEKLIYQANESEMTQWITACIKDELPEHFGKTKMSFQKA